MIAKRFTKTVSKDNNSIILSADIISTQQIKLDSIECILSEDNFTIIFLDDKKEIKTRKPLKEWEIILSNSNFIRVNRTTIINLYFVKHIQRTLGQKLIIYMQNYENPIVMSRNYISKLKNELFI
jgi:DNA-binding LytR/AlgR family response regulator